LVSEIDDVMSLFLDREGFSFPFLQGVGSDALPGVPSTGLSVIDEL